MKIKITSLLGNISKRVVNTLDVDTVADIDKLLKMVVTDREVLITRSDGEETMILEVGSIKTEVFNQKQLLVDWCNLVTDEFPSGGSYQKASI